MRRADWLFVYVNGGRYLLPAYAGVAVLFLAGVRELVAREARELGVLGRGPGWRCSAPSSTSSICCGLNFGREGILETFRRADR